MLAHLIYPLQCYCDNSFPYLTGIAVLNGSFNGTTPENCEGGTVNTNAFT